MKDEQFWANLGKVFRYVHKGSGRIVFQMPRKSKTWQHRLVKQALEAHGLNKVSFSLNGELTTIANNDSPNKWSLRNGWGSYLGSIVITPVCQDFPLPVVVAGYLSPGT